MSNIPPPPSSDPAALILMSLAMLAILALFLEWVVRGFVKRLWRSRFNQVYLFFTTSNSPRRQEPAFRHNGPVTFFITPEQRRQHAEAMAQQQAPPPPVAQPVVAEPALAPAAPRRYFQTIEFERPEAAEEAAPEPPQQAPKEALADDIDLSDLEDVEALIAGVDIPMIPLSSIAQADNIAIIGPKGSAKTTILRSITAVRNGARIVLDPHNFPGKWPGQVVGGGMKYLDIATAFQRLHSKMVTRAEQLDAGQVAEGAFPRRTIVSDEFFSIVTDIKELAAARRRTDKEAPPIPDVGTFLLKRITGGRKFSECVLVVSHNDTLTGLGLPDGSADMKECFDWFIYTGSFTRRSTDKDVRKAAMDMERPIVAYHTATDRWFVVAFDLDVYHKDQLFQTISAVSAPEIPAETGLKQAEIPAEALKPETDTETDDFGVPTPNFSTPDSFKGYDFSGFAQLISAGKLTRKDVLQTVLQLSPGGSKRYKSAQRWLEVAIEQIESEQSVEVA